MGPVQLVHLENPSEIMTHLPRFFRQHIQRRAMAGDVRSFEAEGPRRFYECLVEELDASRDLRFAVLHVGDRVAAYHFGFQHAGKFIWYKPTFHVHFWDAGPGEALLRKLFEYIRDSAVSEFDFTIGEEGFKKRFANVIRRNMHFELYPRDLRGER